MHNSPTVSNPASRGRSIPAPGCIEFRPNLGKPNYYCFVFGQTIMDIARDAHPNLNGLQAEILDGGKWHSIDRKNWRLIRPKQADAIRFSYSLNGGDGGAGQIFAIVATIAIAFVAPHIASAVGLALFTAGLSVTAVNAAIALTPALLSLAVSVGASLLFPPPVARTQTKIERDAATLNNVDADSNLLATGGILPYVAGTRRVTVPEVMQPHSYLQNGRLVLDRCFSWNGEHLAENIEVDGAPITDFKSVEYQIRDGHIETPVETFITRVARTTAVNQELTGFTLDEMNAEDQEDPANSRPREIQFTSEFKPSMDEIAIRLKLQALISTRDADQNVTLPIRLWMRPKGEEEWRGVAEIHIEGIEPGELARDFRFRWDGDFEDDGNQADITGAVNYRVFVNVPPSTDPTFENVAGPQFTAHPSFVSGPLPLASQSIKPRRSGVRTTLKEVDWPKGQYEFKVVRGAMMDKGALSADYKNGSYVPDLFNFTGSEGDWKVRFSQSSFPCRVSIDQVAVIVPKQPVQKPGTGVLAIRSRQSLRRVTAQLSARIGVYSGGDWNTTTESSNPADHMHEVLHRIGKKIGLAQELIRDDVLQLWHDECAARDYQISAIFNGQSTGDVMKSIASAGFARMAFDDGYSVDFLKDRVAELPQMMFSPRNATISFNKQKIERPSAWRVTFADQELEYKQRELVIASPYRSTFPGQEARTFENITREKDIKRRILFDAYSVEHQSTILTVKTSLEGSLLQKGSMIGVVTDLLHDFEHGFRVREVVNSRTLIVDADFDARSTVSLYAEPDVFTLENIFTSGGKSNLWITTEAGVEMVPVEQIQGSTILLADDLQSPDVMGAHGTICEEGQSRYRFIVTDIERGEDFQSTLTCVPEAPQIQNKLLEMFV